MQNLRETLANITLRNLQECYNDIYYRDEMRQHFSTGRVNPAPAHPGRAVFWAVLMRILRRKKRASKQYPATLQTST